MFYINAEVWTRWDVCRSAGELSFYFERWPFIRCDDFERDRDYNCNTYILSKFHQQSIESLSLPTLTIISAKEKEEEPGYDIVKLKIKLSSGHVIALWKKRCGMDQKKLIMRTFENRTDHYFNLTYWRQGHSTVPAPRGGGGGGGGGVVLTYIGYTGMCRSEGWLIQERALDMGPLSLKKILRHGSLFSFIPFPSFLPHFLRDFGIFSLHCKCLNLSHL